MSDKKQTKEISPLSASKIKTLENCSWLYYANYHLKLPQHGNEGAMKGTVCHLLFEILIDKKHEKTVNKIVEAGTVTAVKSVERLLKLFIKKTGLPDHDSIFLQIDQMVLVGLRSDFLPKGGTLVAPEYKFDIINDKFRIKGFIDKPIILGDTILIDDYKSAKMKFKGEDEESNVQALMYSYAARQIWPDLKPVVRFIFLQFPEDPIMTVKFTNDTLKGFEMYLGGIQTRVNTFNEITAKSFFAADQEPHDQGFNGKLLCGFAKSPDQKKKDGTKMWHCPYKFAFDYWIVKKDNKIVYTVFTEEELKPLKPGEVAEKTHYEGCPKHRNVMNLFGAKFENPKQYRNVLDDF